MIEFQISTKHTGEYRRIKVMVYDTIAQLKRATRKRDGFYGWVQDPQWYDQMAATTNAHSLVKVGDDPKNPDEPSIPYITIRLSRDKLRQYPTEIVAHESTHAALYLYKHDCQDDVEGDQILLHDLEKEETLCYLVGEISRKVVNKLYEKAVL
jgi:hypothetical protein